MKSVDNFINILKIKIKAKNYESGIKILQQEIINIYIDEIKKINKNFEYTNIIELLENTEKFLNRKYVIQLKKYYMLSSEDCSKEYELQCLMEIYEKLKEIMKNGF